QVAQVLHRGGTQLRTIEVEEDPAVERHDDPLADALDRRAGDRHRQLLGLLVHLPADQRAGRTADRGADDRAPRRAPRRLPDHAARGCAGRRPDDRAALGVAQVGAAAEPECKDREQRRRPRRTLESRHRLIPHVEGNDLVVVILWICAGGFPRPWLDTITRAAGRCHPSPGGRTAPPFARPGSHPADERRRTTRSCAGTPTPPTSRPPPAAPAPTNRRAGTGARAHGGRGRCPVGARSRSPPRMTPRVVSMRSIRWLAALAAPLVILTFAALSLRRRDAPQYHGTLLDPPLPAHDFTLQSADGPVRLEDLRGDYVAVFFGYPACPDVCPMTLARLATALRALGPDAQGM